MSSTPSTPRLEHKTDGGVEEGEKDDVVSPLRQSPRPPGGSPPGRAPRAGLPLLPGLSRSTSIMTTGTTATSVTSVTSVASTSELSLGSESSLGGSSSAAARSSLPSLSSSAAAASSPSGRDPRPGSDPRRFLAFIVTVTKYDKINEISGAVGQDGADLFEILTNPHVGEYDPDNVVHLQNPTKKQLVKGLKKFRKRARRAKKTTKGRVTTLTYLAGHTGSIRGGRRKGDYLLCKECDPKTNKRMTKGAVKIKDIFKRVLQCGGRSNLLVVHGNHGGEALQGIKSLQITIDKDGTKFGHLSKKDVLTVKGVQHPIDHDLIKPHVKKKRDRHHLSAAVEDDEEYEKMMASANGSTEDPASDGEEFGGGGSFRYKKGGKNKRPKQEIMTISACMSAQLSRFGEPRHGVMPANSTFGLHMLAALCGRTQYQEGVLERRYRKRLEESIEADDVGAEEERGDGPEPYNNSNNNSNNNNNNAFDSPGRAFDRSSPPASAAAMARQSSSSSVNFDNKAALCGRARIEHEAAMTRGLYADDLARGMRMALDTVNVRLEKARSEQFFLDIKKELAECRTALDEARVLVQKTKVEIKEELEALAEARTRVVECTTNLAAKRDESKELAKEAGILASRAMSAEDLKEADAAEEDAQAAMEAAQHAAEALEEAKSYLGRVRENIGELGTTLKKAELDSRDSEKQQNDTIARTAIEEAQEVRRARSPNAHAAPWLQSLFIRTNYDGHFILSRFPKPPAAPPCPLITGEEEKPKALSLAWSMEHWNGAVIDKYETQRRGRSRADTEWKVVRNCPLLPADRHYEMFLNKRIERRVFTAAAGLSPASSVQFRVRCHTAGGWSQFSTPSRFAYTSRSNWWGASVHPRVPLKLTKMLQEAATKKGGVFKVMRIMKNNLDKIALQIAGLKCMSGNVTIATSGTFTIAPDASQTIGVDPRNFTPTQRTVWKRRGKVANAGVKPARHDEHASAVVNAGAIELVVSILHLHCHHAEIQERGLRLLGWWGQQNDALRRRCVNAGGLGLARRLTEKKGFRGSLYGTAGWAVEILRSKVTEAQAAMMMQNAYRRLVAQRKVLRLRSDRDAHNARIDLEEGVRSGPEVLTEVY
jgi:hypothetical protein